MTADQIRSMPLSAFTDQAEGINDSDDLMKVYAAPEWQSLSEDGQRWVCALIRETLAQSVEARH